MSAAQPLIGRSVERKEDYRFLTGAGQYTDDITLPQQSYACFLRSDRAHAEIVSVDTKKALESTEMRARLYVQGLAPVGNTPDEMGAAMKAETALWARVVRERKIKVE